MKTIAFVGALAACAGQSGAPPATGPIVTSMMPQSGPWGTTIAIEGANFGPVPQPGNVVAFDGAGASGFRVDSWHDTEIRGRVAFPATGMLEVQTSGGEAKAGTFTTDMPWAPSAPLDVTQLAEGIVLSNGNVAGIYGQYEGTAAPTLAVFGGGAAGTYSLAQLVDPQAPGAPLAAHVVEADDGTPEVIATAPGGGVEALAVQGGSLVASATGLTGTVIAAGRDAQGAYAWLDTSSGLVRARAGTPWTIDRGPLARPFSPLAGALAADGTLWLAVAQPAPQSQAYLALQVLGPTDNQLGAPELADPGAHDSITSAQLVIAADGVHGLVLASSSSGGHATQLAPRVRTAPGSWNDAPAPAGLAQYAYLGSTLGAVVNDPDSQTTSLVPDVTAPSSAQVIPVWPVLSQAVVIDAAGKPHPLVGNGSVTYALAPPG